MWLMRDTPQDPNPGEYEFFLELSPQLVKWDNFEITKMKGRGRVRVGVGVFVTPKLLWFHLWNHQFHQLYLHKCCCLLAVH